MSSKAGKKSNTQVTGVKYSNAESLQTNNQTVTQSASAVRESREEFRAGNPSSRDTSSSDSQAQLPAGKTTMSRNNTSSSSSDSRTRSQASSSTYITNSIHSSNSNPPKTVGSSKSTSKLSSSSDAQTAPHASASRNMQEKCNAPSASSETKNAQHSNASIKVLRNVHTPNPDPPKPISANPATMSLQSLSVQQSNINLNKKTDTSAQDNMGDEQQKLRPKIQNPPPKDEALSRTVKLDEQRLKELDDRLVEINEKIMAVMSHEQRLKELEEKLDKLNKTIYNPQKNYANSPSCPAASACCYFHRQQAKTMETPEGDLEKPIKSPESEDTARAQRSERDAEIQGNQPASTLEKHRFDREPSNELRRTSIVFTENSAGSESIAISSEPQLILIDQSLAHSPDVNVENFRLQEMVAEKLRLKDIVANLTAKQEALQSENTRLSTTVSKLEDHQLNYEGLLVSYSELKNHLRTHHCPNGDPLELPDSELRDEFVDLETRIQELVDNCNTFAIDINMMLHISKACLANDLPVWWNLKVKERTNKLWLRGLVANVLHARFFERSFYDLDENKQLETGLIEFENLLFAENSGVDKIFALQWRARTFRLASELRNRSYQSPDPRGHEVYKILKPILEPLFVSNTANSFNHLKSLQEICGLALHCSCLLRSSTSSYSWDQRSAPRKINAKLVRCERIKMASEGDPPPPFNVFGELLRLRPNNAPVQVSSPIIGVFKAQ